MIDVTLHIILLAWTYAASSFFFDYMTRRGNLFYFWRKLISNLPEFLAKPLGECVFCLNMQTALWSSISLVYFEKVEILPAFVSMITSHIILVHLTNMYPIEAKPQPFEVQDGKPK